MLGKVAIATKIPTNTGDDKAFNLEKIDSFFFFNAIFLAGMNKKIRHQQLLKFLMPKYN